MATMRRPRYDELPEQTAGGRSGWGVFGESDQLGLINLMTPERVAAAATLVRRGETFALDLPLGTFDPPLNPARRNPTHRVVDQPGGVGFDDAWDDYFPQAGSQWDALGHVGMDRNIYYNGASAAHIRAGERNAVSAWARHGIAGRGVLLDVPAVFEEMGQPYHPGSTVDITVEHLEEARARAGITWRSGDVLLLYTGFTSWYLDQPSEVRDRLPGQVTAPGLEHTEEICSYLWDSGVAAIGSDTFAVESWPADTSADAAPFGFLHHMLIGSFGMALGELWWLEELAVDCRASGVYEGMLVSVPMNAPGGISSGSHALLIK